LEGVNKIRCVFTVLTVAIQCFINAIRRLLKLGWLRNKKIGETQRRRKVLGRKTDRKGGQAAHNRITLISLSKYFERMSARNLHKYPIQ
jgi:hypothetical protein